MFVVFHGDAAAFEAKLNEEGVKMLGFVASPTGSIVAVFDDGKRPEQGKKASDAKVSSYPQ